jgi:GDP-L-fucose synthase
MPDELYPLKNKRVWVAGHRGLVGQALVRRLEREDCEILTVERARLDLRVQADVDAWFADAAPQAIFLAAAKVGGIAANAARPADFLADNLAIEMNVLGAARRRGTQKLLFLGSSCIYPKMAPQPIIEDALLTGPLEPTNEAYAIAKIAGMKLAEAYRRQDGCDFIAAMPTNLYGPGDNFDLETSHVLPALLRKAHEAKARGDPAMTIWGSGAPRRELLHVDDCADALVFLMQRYSDAGPVNVGTGEDVSILELAEVVARAVGFSGEIRTDPSRPDGTPRKRLDVSRLDALGWRASRPLEAGIAETYRWFLDNAASAS